MSKRPNWIWHFYFLVYCFVTAHQAWQFAVIDSNLNMYYHILIAYNLVYIFDYSRNALSVLLNILAIVPFYLFLRRIRWLSQDFWRWFLLFRVFSDITGRIYEIKIIKSLFYQDVLLGRDTIILTALIVLPSYIALIKYAFGQPRRKSEEPQSPLQENKTAAPEPR